MKRRRNRVEQLQLACRVLSTTTVGFVIAALVVSPYRIEMFVGAGVSLALFFAALVALIVCGMSDASR